MSAETLERVRFVVDENLLRVGGHISALRADTTCVARSPVAELLPSGILDPDWIPIVGPRGWVWITPDRRLRTRPLEATLALEHNLKVVHLFNAGHMTSWDQFVRLAARWDSVERQIAAADGPWWLSVRKSGAKLMQFMPGEPERV